MKIAKLPEPVPVTGDRTQPVETLLTPELAVVLLAQRHPDQRRVAHAKVLQYARAIREGRWRLIPDAIMVHEGRMFNGTHRCEAVISANRAIPVYIVWDADLTTFDVIDTGRTRGAYQFISEADATLRASAARITLWYERRFDQPMSGRALTYDMHEIMTEVDRRAEAFDQELPAARAVYEYTTISKAVALAVFAIAHDMGYHEEVDAYAEAVKDPSYLPADDPARLLTERFRRQTHRGQRRTLAQDWMLLAFTFNCQIEGRRIAKLILSDVPPRIAEPYNDYRRRAATVHGRDAQRARRAESRLGGTTRTPS
jgi:hypothetical protein